jgi:hypothetical protein
MNLINKKMYFLQKKPIYGTHLAMHPQGFGVFPMQAGNGSSRYKLIIQV